MVIQKQAQQGSNWEYLCSLLRTLLTIPYDSLVGRGMWRLIVSTANRVVTINMKENVEFLSNEDILDLINRKQLLNERYDAIHDEDTSQDMLRQRIRQLEDELMNMKHVTRFAVASPDYSVRLVSDLLSQVSDVMNVKFARDDPVYSKYFTLLESGAHMEDVVELCRREGNDERVVHGPAVTLTVKQEYIKRIQNEAVKNMSSVPVTPATPAAPATPATPAAPAATVVPGAPTASSAPAASDAPANATAPAAPVDDPNDPRKKPE